MLPDFLAKVRDIGFEAAVSDETGDVNIYFRCCSWWRISLYLMDDGSYFPLIYFRQKRIEEVTDIHEVIPTVFAGMAKSEGCCSFRFLGEHNDFSGIDDELYGMYIFPAQPFGERIRPAHEQDLDGLLSILSLLFFYHLC